MGLESISFFRNASQRLEWLGARQKVISQNIANSDTPDFKAKDVQPFSKMLEGAQQSGLVTTNSKHIGSNPVSSVGTETIKDVWGETIDGNTVVLEQQSILANEVGEDYQLAARLYRKGYDLLTLAVTGIR
jgi:flagellar basal-body rod protein FlgB